MIVARLFRGPHDGELLTIPEKVPTFVVAQFEPITVEAIYCLAGPLEDELLVFAYLYAWD